MEKTLSEDSVLRKNAERLRKNRCVVWRERQLPVCPQNPASKEIAESYNRRIEAILEKLRGKRSCPVDSLEVKEIIGEYGFTMKQFSQSKDERGMMLSIAHSYREKLIKTKTDEKYGEGAAEFFAQQNF